MKIFQVVDKFSSSDFVHVICDTYKEAEELFHKHYPQNEIVAIKLVSSNCINMWAQ